MYLSFYNIKNKINLKSFLFFTICITFFAPKYHAQEFCGQAQVMEAWFKKHPEKRIEFEKLLNQKQDLDVKSFSKISATPNYTIPVVFHILHLDGIENISDAQVINQVAILNRDFQKKNADTLSIVPSFTNNIANVGFQFELATIDPDGNCTNGIVRHYTPKTNWDANDLNQFIYTWPADRYLNFYIVKTINISATAYTFLPGIGIPANADAIVGLHQMVGNIGTGSVANSRTLTHEVAHWFSIPHIWGVSNAPGVACGDDGISDTPITKGFVSCNTTNNAICNPGIEENVQNYMDYAPCKIMFTNGQAAAMVTSINSSINNRDNLSTATNLILTGVQSPTLSCSTKADFYTTKKNNCTGNVFTFTSLSQFGSASGTLNWSFPGGTPSSSSNSVVSVSYNLPGTYTVSLTATSSNGVNTETKSNYITVANGYNGLLLPYSEDFESASLPSNLFVTNEQMDTVLWKLNKSLGANSTNQCIYINNFPDSTNYGNRDFFETPYFDFSNTSAITFSYYYAYAKRYAAQADSFRIQYSLDCGGSWISLLGVPTINTMATNSGGTVTAAFFPTSAQWKQVNIPSAFLNVLNNKPSVKFRFFFKNDYYVDGSNNIYIDQININGSVVTSVSELDKKLSFNLYPNPGKSKIFMEFISPTDNVIKLNVFDVTDRCLLQNSLNTQEGSKVEQEIDVNNLCAGVYFVTLHFDGQTLTKKLIVE